MKRRDFLVSTAGIAFGARVRARSRDDSLGRWRVFEITTSVDVRQRGETTRVWLPTPLPQAPYQRTLGDTYKATGGRAVMVESSPAPDMLAAVWEEGEPAVLTMTNRVETRDHAVDLDTAIVPPPADSGAFARYLRATLLIPIDGIVKEKATAITRGARTDVDKARAIYDWIVDNTFRDPKVVGGGTGDIRFMLESGNLGGTCADINALFVGLARASGIPARSVYGLRVAKSRQEFPSLGLASGDATRAQHCRAEVYLTGCGWVPVDPADVRKVALEEPPGSLPISDLRVARARQRLFGAWEMNWIGFNDAHDVALPGSRGPAIPYFMYPQAETPTGRVDSLDADAFRYSIGVREIE